MTKALLPFVFVILAIATVATLIVTRVVPALHHVAEVLK